MLERLILLAVVIGAAYWYWSGPYQDRLNPSLENILEQNDAHMAECKRAAAYKLGATGSGTGPEVAEQQCAEKHNLYLHDGRWHSYDMTRPE